MASPEPHWTNLFGHQTTIAEWASIVALFVSLYAAITITRVRRQIVGRVRLPDLVSAIEKNAATFSELMQSYETNTDAYELELARCETFLRLIKRKIKGAPRSTTKRVLQSIRVYRGKSRIFWRQLPRGQRQDAWAIYTNLNGLIAELNNTLEEQKLGG